MSTRWAFMLIAVAGVATVFILVILVSSPPTYPQNAQGGITPLPRALWMHSEAPTSFGNESRYNITLTVNQTVPLSDMFFRFYFYWTPDIVLPPATFKLILMASTPSGAQYNFTTFSWTSGGSGSLVKGDWFEAQVTNQSLADDKLVAFGQGSFSSTSIVQFQ